MRSRLCRMIFRYVMELFCKNSFFYLSSCLYSTAKWLVSIGGIYFKSIGLELAVIVGVVSMYFTPVGLWLIRLEVVWLDVTNSVCLSMIELVELLFWLLLFTISLLFIALYCFYHFVTGCYRNYPGCW